MQEFYKIKTTDFKPISFKNSYLFNEYDKIKNFLKSNNQENLLNKLAIPIIRKKEIYWLSESKEKIDKIDVFDSKLQQIILEKYKRFKENYKSFISDLNNSKNQDKKNWGRLLSHIINGSANELFYDGENIYITWGWELISENNRSLIPKFIASKSVIEEEVFKTTKEKIYSHKIKTYSQLEINQKISFLDKCHFFIKKNWWITPSLTIIIFLLLILAF